MEGWVKEFGTDEMGIRRWCGIIVLGNNFHTCQIICAYKPVRKVTENMEGKKMFMPRIEDNYVLKESSDNLVKSLGRI